MGSWKAACLPSQGGSTAFRMRHCTVGGGWFSGPGWEWIGGGQGWGGRNKEAFYLQGIWAELQQEAQGPGGGFTLQECIQLGNYDFSQVNIPFSYFLSKIELVRQVAGDSPPNPPGI